MKMNPSNAACLLIALFLVLTLGVHPMQAAKENGAKKCSDGLDNDGDGLIDGDDPDCGGGGEPLAASVNAGWISSAPQPIHQTSLVSFDRTSLSSSGSEGANYESTEAATVSFDLTAADIDHTHWDASYCTMLEGVDLLIEAGKFKTKWFLQGGDNCFDIPCVATATMTHLYNLPDLDRVVIIARTEEFTANDVGADGDMFQGAATEEIYMATVKASFYVPGQNRADGACVWHTSIPSLWTVVPAAAP